MLDKAPDVLTRPSRLLLFDLAGRIAAGLRAADPKQHGSGPRAIIGGFIYVSVPVTIFIAERMIVLRESTASCVACQFRQWGWVRFQKEKYSIQYRTVERGSVRNEG